VSHWATLVTKLRTLLTLAWPIVLARATQSVIGFSDALMVAPLGEAPLAAVTTGAMNAFSMIILPMGATFILASFTSQLRGRGDYRAIPRYAYCGLALAAIAGVLSLLLTPALSYVVSKLGYAPEVAAMMDQYMAIRLLSVAPAVGLEALGNWYGGLGNTRASFIAGTVAMVLNVALCYLLIEPRFGLPGYGVAGSAWASTIASWAGFAVILIGFLQGRGLPSDLLMPKGVGLRWQEFKRVLRFGLPNGLNWFLEFSAFALFINVVIGHLGTSALAAFNIVIQVNSVSFMPALGLASAGAIMVGEAIGRREHDAAAGWVKLTFALAAGWMGSVGLIYFLFPGFIIGWFDSGTTNTRELFKLATLMLTLSSVWQLFDAAGITISEALRAAGDTTFCMMARLVLAWVVFTPVSYALVVWHGGGIYSMMFCFIGYLALLSVTFTLRFASNKWRAIDLVGEPALLDAE
jgi:MATE family multidrug resistance protein